MRILVTGAAGFVGSHLVRAALARGHEVVAAVRAPDRIAALGAAPGLTTTAADLGDRHAMRGLADTAPDVALHCAWAIGPDYYDSPASLACVGGTLALLQGLADAGCPRVVLVGTHLELAPSDDDLTESAPVAPRGLYAVCKDAVRRIADARLAPTTTSLVWARLFNLYGPGQAEWALVPTIARDLLAGRQCAMTHGEQRRGFLHVCDAADALLAVAESPIRGVVHVGSDEVVRVRDVALRIGEHLGRTELLAFGARTAATGDAPRVVAGTARLRSEVGFHPRVPLDDGLRDTVDWYRARARQAS